MPRTAEHKRAARILKSLAEIGLHFEAAPGYLQTWTTIPRDVVIAAVPQRDRPSVFFLRHGEDAGAYLWPEDHPVRQEIRDIPVDRPLAVEDIEISRLEKRGSKGEDEFCFEIPYPMKMRASRDGRQIQLAVVDILSDEDMLRSSGMSARSDAHDIAKVSFLAARTWAFEGGFMIVPIDEEVEVEPQLRTYEKQMCSRYVYSEEAAQSLRLLGVELFNRLLAARRMKRLRL